MKSNDYFSSLPVNLLFTDSVTGAFAVVFVGAFAESSLDMCDGPEK